MCSDPGPSGPLLTVRSCGQAGIRRVLALCHVLSEGEAKQAPQLGVHGTPMPGAEARPYWHTLGAWAMAWKCEEQSPRRHGRD